VHEQLKIDFLAALPVELSYKVLGYLDTVSLCKAAQVSRRWRSLADDDVVWHHMCEQHIHRKCTKCGWGLPLLERQRLRTWRQQQEKRREEEETHETTETTTTSNGSKKRELVVREDSRKKVCTNGAGDTSSAEIDRPSSRLLPWYVAWLRRLYYSLLTTSQEERV